MQAGAQWGLSATDALGRVSAGDGNQLIECSLVPTWKNELERC